MSLSRILQEDFEYITANYDFSVLKGKSVFITGSTGLLGSQLLKYMWYLNDSLNYGIRLYALARKPEKVKAVFSDISQNAVTFVYGDVLNLPPCDFDIDYIIHGASITSSRDFIDKAVETIDIAVNGTLNMLRLAQEKQVKSMVYLSSMEVFGTTDGNKACREENLGYIDIMSPRSSYSESKRLCECLCASYAAEYGVDVKIARLTQTFGYGIDYSDSRIAAYFARSVIEKQDIILKTRGDTKRPLLYARDAASAILTVLVKGNAGEAYTAANPNTFTTVRETAEIIVKNIACNNIKLRYDIKEVPKEYAQNVNLNLNLNVDKLRSLGWKPSVGLEEAYRKLIEGMREYAPRSL